MEFSVQVGNKFWCSVTDGDGVQSNVLATPGMSGAIPLIFPTLDQAWNWATKHMEDPNGNKFRVVDAPTSGHQEGLQSASAPITNTPSKTARKRKVNKSRRKAR